MPSVSSVGVPTTIPIAPVSTGVFSVSFVSTTQGWVIGQRGCGAAPTSCLYLYETFDRGGHWLAKGAPAAGGPSEVGAIANYVSEVRFANARDGYAFNRSLWMTTDGGDTWRPGAVPDRAWAIDVEADDGTAYLLTAPCGDGIGNCEGYDTVYSAPVGSAAWRPIGHFDSGLQDGQVATDRGSVYAILGGPNGALLGGSSDGLSSRPLPAGCVLPEALAAWNPDGLVLLCGLPGPEGSGDPTRPSGLFTSTDGGRHWTASEVPPPGNMYDSLAAPAPGVVFLAVAGPGTLATGVWKSTDSGQHWTMLLSAPLASSYVGFETPEDGLLIASSGLYLTGDGGATWTAAEGWPAQS